MIICYQNPCSKLNTSQALQTTTSIQYKCNLQSMLKITDRWKEVKRERMNKKGEEISSRNVYIYKSKQIQMSEVWFLITITG